MSKWGGGGSKCTICAKTVYPAETIQYEKKPYHVDCFKCSTCDKKMEGASKAAAYEDKIFCTQCFAKGGFAQKQKNVKWVKKEGTGSAVASKFGGGGNPCQKCNKTVYPAETLSFEKRIYHQECFTCGDCSKKMTASDGALFEDKVVCRKCFADNGYRNKQAKSASKSTGSGGASSALASKFGGGGNPCTICSKTVYSAEMVSFEKQPYHSECFNCSDCSKKMTVSQANKFDDKIICSKCFGDGGYRAKQAKSSGKGTGATTSAKFSKFGGGGTKCVRCDKTVYPAELVSYEKNAFHGECFQCKKCNKKLTPSGAEGKKLDDGGVDVYCKKCWGEEGLNRAKVNQ